jgi:hypothetical protein
MLRVRLIYAVSVLATHHRDLILGMRYLKSLLNEQNQIWGVL